MHKLHTHILSERTKAINEYRQCQNFPVPDISTLGETIVTSGDNKSQVVHAQ